MELIEIFCAEEGGHDWVPKVLVDEEEFSVQVKRRLLSKNGSALIGADS
jgi:hypothetical protein